MVKNASPKRRGFMFKRDFYEREEREEGRNNDYFLWVRFSQILFKIDKNLNWIENRC